MTKKLNFPNLNIALCPEERITLKEASENYRNMLLETDTWYNILYANKLGLYQSMVEPRNLNLLKKDISQYASHMKAWKKEKHYNFHIYIQRRIKSFDKYNQKTRLFLLYQNEASSIEEKEKYSLSRIRDGIGFRIILCCGKTDKIDDIKLCYEFMNETINFFTKIKGYNPEIAEPKLFLGFEPSKYPSVVVPSKKEISILEGYEENVKDYVANPKSNSYQSLHIVFRNKSGQPFEIQLRTFAMHTRVEYVSAAHNKHDEERYPKGSHVKLERENINIFGYDFVNGIVEDFVGLEKAIDPFNFLY